MGTNQSTALNQEITAMRTATSLRLLLIPAALLAAACDDVNAPLEPPSATDEAALSQPPATLATGRWADGYLFAGDPTAASSTLSPPFSFNRSGGRITVTKVAGTTGRYIARFAGLSALLGTGSTVHVTGYNYNGIYCKPVGAYLVRDSVEVRCFKTRSGAAANTRFTLLASAKRADRAFAFAHQPTATGYSPAAAGSWNPAGTSKVTRTGVGQYLVTFNGLGARLPAGVGGHVQVNAVGAGKAHCEIGAWGGSPDLAVRVGCYTPAGAPVDAKFTVLFALPAAHLAYALADQLALASYSPSRVYSSNPVGGAITITHDGPGYYSVAWAGIDPEIIEYGSVQVTAYGDGGAECNVGAHFQEDLSVQCFAPNGTPVDSYFTVLLHS
jgi:hypothetical protein